MFFYLPPSFLPSSISAFPSLVRQQMIRVWKKIGGFLLYFFASKQIFFPVKKRRKLDIDKIFPVRCLVHILTNTLLTDKKSKVFYVDYIKMHEK